MCEAGIQGLYRRRRPGCTVRDPAALTAIGSRLWTLVPKGAGGVEFAVTDTPPTMIAIRRLFGSGTTVTVEYGDAVRARAEGAPLLVARTACDREELRHG
jgi:hypothetical protein